MTSGTAILLVTVAAAVLGGVALGAGGFGSSSDQQALVQDAAHRLNVTPEQLKSALEQAFDARVDAAVAAGELSKAQGERLKQAAAQGALGLPDGGRFGGPFGGRFGHHRLERGELRGVMHAAAAYLGLSDDQLREQLDAGKSLADIVASQPGKSVDGLKQAITDAVKADLAQAVADGRLTQAEADALLGRLSARLDDLIARKGPLCDHGGPRGGMPPPGGQTPSDQSSFAPPLAAPA